MKNIIVSILILQSVIANCQIDTSKTIIVRMLNASDVFYEVDTMPLLRCNFEGNGTERINSFIAANIKYTESGYECNSTVFIQLIVEPSGSISNIDITKEPASCKSLCEEALRIANLMDKWIPGVKDNKKVKVHMTIPISFSKI